MKVYELMNALSTCSAGAEVIAEKLMTESEFLALEDCGNGRDVGGTVSDSSGGENINDKVYLYLD